MPSIWSDFLEHTDVRRTFSEILGSGRLAQSYLFVGPAGIGKKLFAWKFAQCLLCRECAPRQELEACGECESCRPFLIGAHPDFLHVECPPGKRELTIDLFAGSPEQRGRSGLCYELSIRPLDGSRKIAIIDTADLMNDASANAILKTLEEPPERAIMILVADNLDSILPTIRSRCQLVRFQPLSNPAVEELLLRHEFASSQEDAHAAAALGEGSLTVAQQFLDANLRELQSIVSRGLFQKPIRPMLLAKQVQEGLESIATETVEQRKAALALLRYLVEYLRGGLWNLSTAEGDPIRPASSPDAEHLTQRWSAQPQSGVERIGRLIERILDAGEQIDHNVTISLCFEALFTDLQHITSS